MRRVLASVGFLVLVGGVAVAVAVSGFGQPRSSTRPPPNPQPDSARLADGPGGPTMDDHWHAAYGVYLCEGWAAGLLDAGVDANGIHTHGDGLVHLHPFSSEATGANATLGEFLDVVGLEVTPDGLTMPDGGTFPATTGCDGQPAKLVVAVWPSADSSEPEVFTSEFERLRFLADGEVWVIALVPDGATIDKPPSVGNLTTPGDI